MDALPGQLLDEVDRAIVHALQIHPRAPWTLVGDVLNVNPVTAARRWQRMAEAGLAWVTAYPRLSGPGVVVSAIVEIDTEPGAGERVAETLAADPAVVNVKLVAGGRDLVATLHSASLGDLTRRSNALAIPGVRATRTHVATAVPTDGSRWRLRSLDAQACARLEAAARPPARNPRPPVWDALDDRLLQRLGEDARTSTSDLAEAVGAGLTTVRARMHALLASGVSLRCDLARPLSGWPLSAVYFASVPAEHLHETSEVLSRALEVRSCAVTAGPHNLVIDVWLRALDDVHAFEAHLSRRLPRLSIQDRSVVLRTVKHMGRLLDPTDGHCVGVIPIRLPQSLSRVDQGILARLNRSKPAKLP